MILSVVGDSKSGKTTIVTNLVSALKERGLKVAVVKHTHGFEIDREGKDSWKIYKSGADVVVSSKDKLALIKRQNNDNFDEIYNKYLKDYDFVITEGYNEAAKDRVVVLNSKDYFNRYTRGKILAIVSNFPVEGYVNFKKSEIDKLVDYILKYFKI